MPHATDHARIATPIGAVTLWGDDHWLHGVTITPGDAVAPQAGTTSPVRAATDQLQAYFDGSSSDFDLPLSPLRSGRGMALRNGIAGVGYGQTISYGGLARQLGSGPRAVGQACRCNPFPIIIPCHRIVSSAGAPEHYSAGDGIATKAWLLAHERRNKER